MAISRKLKKLAYKLLSLFSVVRGHTIILVIIAQYLSAIYVLSKAQDALAVLLDASLFCIVMASAFSIASGYIINNFYDREKDLINRPYKAMLDRLVKQQTKLTGYFVLNLVSVVFASYVSFRAVLFFSVYIFCLWFYSHKLKKMLFYNNLMASILAIIPFFAVFIYYKNFDIPVFVHAIFLFLLVLLRDLIKDLENIKGDLALNYTTIAVYYGERIAKRYILVVGSLALIFSVLLYAFFTLGYMRYYFIISFILLSLLLVLVIFARQKKEYVFLHILLKIMLFLGVFSVVLYD